MTLLCNIYFYIILKITTKREHYYNHFKKLYRDRKEYKNYHIIRQIIIYRMLYNYLPFHMSFFTLKCKLSIYKSRVLCN